MVSPMSDPRAGARRPTSETFTLGPDVSRDPTARPHRPVRANMPGEPLADGLHIDDLDVLDPADPSIRPALLGEPHPDPFVEGAVRCNACAHRCVLRPSRVGLCGVRQNRGGRLATLVYGAAIAAHAEPIEKKPLYHVLPGSDAFSIATRGCSFHCDWCQNWEMAQGHREGIIPASRWLPPDAVIREAQAAGARSVAYTYVEPTVFLEYALDTMALAREAGLRNVFVTNGYQTPEALALLAPLLDAANVDLKSFRDRAYRRSVGARVQPVLDAIVEMRRLGIWVEVTTLVVPGLNDSDDELAAIARWLVSVLGPDVPWHVSRFYGAHRMLDVPSTPATTLRRAAELGRAAGLRYVYVGNAPEVGGEATICPGCGTAVIERRDFRFVARRMVGDRCATCGRRIPGIGLA
jgi:pyruvate formate lyase activating enzyme